MTGHGLTEPPSLPLLQARLHEVFEHAARHAFPSDEETIRPSDNTMSRIHGRKSSLCPKGGDA